MQFQEYLGGKTQIFPKRPIVCLLFNPIQFIIYLFSTIKTIQDKKFKNTIATYVATLKVMTKTVITIVTKNGQI